MKLKKKIHKYLNRGAINCDELINSIKNEKMKIVLRNLCKIEYGKTISYSEFASKCGFERQTRNIATLIGKNPFPVIIPCHRVIKKNGQIGKYLLGSNLKKELIDFESKKIDRISDDGIKVIEDNY